MELEEAEITRIQQFNEESRFAGWRSDGAVEIGGQQTGHAGVVLKANCIGRSTAQHGGAVKGANLSADEAGSVLKGVRGPVVSVRPNSQLGIIWKVAAIVELVAIVAAGSIRRRRDRHTPGVVAGIDLSHHPTLGRLVPHGFWISAVAVGAISTEAAPHRVN